MTNQSKIKRLLLALWLVITATTAQPANAGLWDSISEALAAAGNKIIPTVQDHKLATAATVTIACAVITAYVYHKYTASKLPVPEARRTATISDIQAWWMQDAENGNRTGISDTLMCYENNPDERAEIINYRNELQQTALMLAASGGHIDVIEALLTAGADDILEARDDLGLTALMYAAIQGHTAIVQRLLRAGANVRLQDNHNRTALTYARYYNASSQRLIEILTTATAPADGGTGAD